SLYRWRRARHQAHSSQRRHPLRHYPFWRIHGRRSLQLWTGHRLRHTTNGVFTSLVTFQGTNGSNPYASLVMGNDGNLYGTTLLGGPGGGGTIFRIVLTPRLSGITRLANGDVSLTGTGPSGSPFRLWTSTDVAKPLAFWTLLTNSTFAADGTFSLADTAAANLTARFYRVSVP